MAFVPSRVETALSPGKVSSFFQVLSIPHAARRAGGRILFDPTGRAQAGTSMYEEELLGSGIAAPSALRPSR